MPKIGKLQKRAILKSADPYPCESKKKVAKYEKKKRLESLKEKIISDKANANKQATLRDNPLFDLDGLTSSLPEREDLPSREVSIKSNNSKHRIAFKESQRMNLVQQHPEFIKDPVAATKLHIEQILLKIHTKDSRANTSTEIK